MYFIKVERGTRLVYYDGKRYNFEPAVIKALNDIKWALAVLARKPFKIKSRGDSHEQAKIVFKDRQATLVTFEVE